MGLKAVSSGNHHHNFEFSSHVMLQFIMNLRVRFHGKGESMTNERILIPPIENFDPFRHFLKDKLKLTPVLFGLIILALNILVDGFIGLHYKVFLKVPFPPAPPGILQDFMALVTDGVYTPILCGLYLWAPIGSTQVFQRLIDDRIFKSSEKFKSVIDANRKIYASKIPFFIILAFSLFMSIIQLGAYFEWFPWKTVGGYIDWVPQASFYRFPFWVILFYTLPFAAFNVGVTIYTLRASLHAKDIHVIPLHPDKCGGLGSISKYTTVIGFGIGTIGLVLSAATVYEVMFGAFEKAVPVIVGVVAYLGFGPFFFFLPLGTAHSSMKKAKEDELLGIAQQFTRLYHELDLSKTQASPEEFNKKLANLENVKKLYEVVNAFPVWPFDVKSLSRFMTIIATPVLPAFIAIIEAVVSEMIK